MKSKTLIEKQLKRKKDSKLVRTIILAKKNNKWLRIAEILSGPKRKQASINLSEINKQLKQGETIVVPGKVLSLGEITKKGRVVALSFSKKAKEKLLKSGNKILNIFEEIKSNPEAKGIKIIK